MSINGDLDLNGVLAIELAGTALFDVLDIAGTATLGGTLDVSLVDPGSGLFSPRAGERFDILSDESIVGQFDLLTLAVLDDGLNWDVSYIVDDFGTDFVRLGVVATVPLPPALWLFGSALSGLTGVARRKAV